MGPSICIGRISAAHGTGSGVPRPHGLGPPRICVGRIGAAHGTSGEVKLWPFTAEPGAVADYGALETADGARRLEIASLRPAKDFLIARFKGVADRTSAERLRNIDLYVPRERLPAPAPDEFYYADLIGLAVEDGTGAKLGAIVAVHNYGAGNLLEIARGNASAASVANGDHAAANAAGRVSGETVLIPFTAAMVPTVDIAGGRVIVDPQAGLLNLPFEEGCAAPVAALSKC
jgi:16S rRNA processing protein RimM